MNKTDLYSALLFLMLKLEETKSNPMLDKNFVEALTEVLRYFRDNGELKKAYEIQKDSFIDSRPDITGSKVSRHDMRQDDLVNLQLSLNAQEIINISKLRLCNKASEETREVWYKVLDKLACIEPLLASACVPQCVYRGFCPEQKSCGGGKNKIFSVTRKYYKNLELYTAH